MTSARRWFFWLFVPVCFLVFAYPPMRLGQWAGMGLPVAGTLLLWALGAGGLWWSFRRPLKWLRYVVVHWMGAGFILMVVTAAAELVRPVVADGAALAGVVVAVAAGLTVAAVAASHLIRVKRLTLVGARLTAAHRIVQVSDVHIGSRSAGFLRRVVRRINRLGADTVVITGDLVDTVAVGAEELQSLGELQARTLFTLGNHERYAQPARVIEVLRGLGVEVLCQQRTRAGEVEFVGIDDADARDQVARELPGVLGGEGGVDGGGENGVGGGAGVAGGGGSGAGDNNGGSRYTVLLYHRPLGWSAARAHGVDLMLSGHTHNGQIFPFNLLVKHQFRRIHGLYSEGGAHLYVSPGTGTWGPLMRLGSWNEITCIDLLPPAA